MYVPVTSVRQRRTVLPCVFPQRESLFLAGCEINLWSVESSPYILGKGSTSRTVTAESTHQRRSVHSLAIIGPPVKFF